MIFLIAGIAVLIGLIISVTKSLRFLREEDTVASRKWAFIAVGIVLVYALFIFIVNKLANQALQAGTSLQTYVGVQKKRILKIGETRESGLPKSNYDVIMSNGKAVNRSEYKIRGVKAILTKTADPDFNADGKIKMGFADWEFSFSEDVTLKEDVSGFGMTLKEVTFNKGVIYSAEVSAPADATLGYFVKYGDGKSESFYFSIDDDGLIPYKNLIN